MAAKDPNDVCEMCGSGNAVVHLTQIENDEISTSHLCETCAGAKKPNEFSSLLYFTARRSQKARPPGSLQNPSR